MRSGPDDAVQSAQGQIVSPVEAQLAELVDRGLDFEGQGNDPPTRKGIGHRKAGPYRMCGKAMCVRHPHFTQKGAKPVRDRLCRRLWRRNVSFEVRRAKESDLGHLAHRLSGVGRQVGETGPNCPVARDRDRGRTVSRAHLRWQSRGCSPALPATFAPQWMQVHRLSSPDRLSRQRQ